VVLVVDDLHWSDPSSLTWFAYLARRLDGLAVALILGARPAEPGVDHTLLDQLRAIPRLTCLHPAPPSLRAVEELAQSSLGEEVEQTFSQACHAMTAGNPFYVNELLRALRHEGVRGTAASASAVDRLTPTAVVEATVARLQRMPTQARSVAETFPCSSPAPNCIGAPT
jgi:predicted ATPase